MADLAKSTEVERGAGDTSETTIKKLETEVQQNTEDIEIGDIQHHDEQKLETEVQQNTEDIEIGDIQHHDEQVSEKTENDSADKEENIEKEEDNQPEFDDVLGSGALLKKIIKKGSGQKSKNGDQVTVRWSRKIVSTGKTFPTEELTFIAGDGDVVQALDLIVVLVHVGDEVEVKVSHRFMYGVSGLPPDVPPNSDFHLYIEVISNSGPIQYDDMDFDTRFKEAKVKKERGNFLFKRKEYVQAMSSYVKASKIVDPDSGCVFPDESPEKLQELLEFRAVVMCNTSVAQLRCEAYDAAVKSALAAIKLSPSYSKAYYRLGQAYEMKGKLDQTIKAYKTALKYDPENSKVLHGELARLTKINRKAKESEQKMYSKMFWGDKPPSVSQNKVKENNSIVTWLKRAGLTVVGACVVGLTGIGLYKYMNHG